MRIRIVFAFLLLILPTTTRADNWPAWRGPDGQGHTAETKLPLTWGPKENVRWRIDLPDAGNSTPAVWGDKVFVTQATNKTVWPPKNNAGPATAETRSLLCLKRADGSTLWQTCGLALTNSRPVRSMP